ESTSHLPRPARPPRASRRPRAPRGAGLLRRPLRRRPRRARHRVGVHPARPAPRRRGVRGPAHPARPRRRDVHGLPVHGGRRGHPAPPGRGGPPGGRRHAPVRPAHLRGRRHRLRRRGLPHARRGGGLSPRV
ncbi:MAG: hypothetical protein AVDCRST_MAG13-2770, partial [uncultured Solirubrobacteraceae bacterium]